MSSWGNYDNANSVPFWAAMQVKQRATSDNATALYNNTTPDAYITGETIGVYGVDEQEAAASSKHGSTGWTLRTTGSGGRAGRVQEEVLVALSHMYGDGDGQTYANVSITLVGPSDQSVLSNTAFANVAMFSVTPTLTGNTSATLTYLWQYLNGSTWTNLTSNNSTIHYSGGTTNTLYAMPGTTGASGTIYRCTVTAANQGVVAYSSNATITIAS